MPPQGGEQRQYRSEVTVMSFIGTLRFISHPNNSNGMRACIPARIREKPGPFTRPPPRVRIQLNREESVNETMRSEGYCSCPGPSVCLSLSLVWRSHTLSQRGEGLICLIQRHVQNNRKSVISNQIAEQPIRSILGLRDVTLLRNVQIQQHGEKHGRGGAELLYTREMLTVSFDRLVSHLVLVVGREIHGESFLIAQCLVCGTCACTYLNGKMIASMLYSMGYLSIFFLQSL